MKKLILAIALITIMLSAGLLAGCDRVLISEKSGPETSRDYEFTDFTGIDIGNAFELEVTYADTYKVTITAGQNVLDRIKVSKMGDTLQIDMDDWFFFWHSTPKARITMPVLKELDCSGATEVNVKGFRSAEDFTLSLSGASHLDIDMETGDFDAEISGASKLIGYLKTANSDIEFSGASEVKLTGSAGDLMLDGSGASHAGLSGFAVNDADIELSGASHAEADVSGKMDVALSGASSLEYSGNPTIGRVDITGASSMEEKEGGE